MVHQQRKKLEHYLESVGRSCQLVIDEYLQHLSQHLRISGSSPDSLILFPRELVVVGTTEQTVLELKGLTKVYRPLSLRVQIAESATCYLNQLESTADRQPLLRIRGNDNAIVHLVVASQDVIDKLESQFGISMKTQSALIPAFRHAIALQVDTSADRMVVTRSILGNEVDGISRIKHVVFALVLEGAPSPDEAATAISSVLNEGVQREIYHGVVPIDTASQQHVDTALQFANLFLDPLVNEAELERFVLAHPEMMAKAFGAGSVASQPTFEWVDSPGESDDKEIRPDFVWKNNSDQTVVCDLKRGLVERSDLTKGRHKRRRFVDAVQEGVAQLANYADYFSRRTHMPVVNAQLGWRAHEFRYILVVGNADNLPAQKLEEAMRGTASHIEIISYSTLCTMYLQAVGIVR